MKKYPAVKLIILCCFLVLTGCVSSKYQQQHLTDILEYTEEIQEKYVSDEEWWKQYDNEEINRLIEIALERNPDYLKAAVNINKQLYNLSLTTSDFFPTFDSSLKASSQRAIYKDDNFANTFSGEVGLSYEIDLYGKIRNARSAQEFELKATVMDQATAKLSLINSVIDLFFNLEYLENAIALTNENINSYTEIEEIIGNQYRIGATDGLELLQAEQNLLSGQKSLLDLETQFREMEQSLRNILNIKPDEDLGIVYSSLLDQKNLGVNVDVPLSVLANRPDLIASQYRLEEAFKTLKAGEREWYPSISLSGAINTSSGKALTTFKFPYILGSVSVSLPFLDWNRVRNNIRISEADYQIALIDFNDTLNQALNEVAYYYFAYQKSIEIFDKSQEISDTAEKIADYYDRRYTAGKAGFKDLLEAINSKNSSKMDLIQQKYQIIKYENYIYKAMAGRYTVSENAQDQAVSQQ
ncbi:TolC family protein [Brucepastera parasyntrophica]|uniref:efflux transporter outer membrane subunit n=1 Tax=Brucepastera parasyntrophica TaxID=2880008 RepID=UPI00210DDC8D|nr:TolC family protein [Brucepastera parasyntrophica]ULQ59271.1 TolC family protein [Brucepastera parasyntrophica]